ncbi:hypothetical protein ACWEJ6_49500 [Nonomuraea sp. NPDC004702]
MAGKNYSEEFKDEVVKAVLDERSTIGQSSDLRQLSWTGRYAITPALGKLDKEDEKGSLASRT